MNTRYALHQRCRLAVAWALVMTVALGVAPAFAADKVSLRLDWIPGAEHAFMYLAKDKGWFAAENLDVDIVAGQGSTLSVKLVGNGDNDFAFSDGATLVQAWETGVPLVSLAVLYHDTPTVVVAKKQQNITRLQDLCGKRMGVMIKSTTYAQFKGMLTAAGLKDCKLEEIPASPAGKELMADAVQAQHHYTFLLPIMMRQQGMEVTEIPARSYFKLYSQTLITNKKTLDQRRDVAARFMKVSMRALRHSVDNPDETLASFTKAHKEANAAYEREKLKVVTQFFTAEDPAAKGLGMQSQAGWTETAKTLHKLEITKSVVDTTGKFTNDFLK
jgi:ABC-type nitrate/sulfonate/bicarbonate transport system substrate-binding protein